MRISGGGDDAVKFGSDYSTGKIVESYDVNVTNSIVGSNGCNALQFGSETLGNFHEYLFENISITSAGKAGIGIVSMDGAQIYNVVYRNITVENATTALYMYIGGRLRRPPAGLASNDSLVGSIHDITIENVHATRVFHPYGRNWTATIEGQPPDTSAGLNQFHYVGPKIVFTNFSDQSAGGGSASSIVPPHPSLSYPPRYLGYRPAFGMFVRRAKGLSLSHVNVTYAEADGRPAFMFSDVHDVKIDRRCTAERSSPSIGFDVGLREKCDQIHVETGSLLVVQNLTSFS
eukprot:SAG31_NODE_204_length_20414_cov_19.143392_24_plen_289_part_00